MLYSVEIGEQVSMFSGTVRIWGLTDGEMKVLSRICLEHDTRCVVFPYIPDEEEESEE